MCCRWVYKKTWSLTPSSFKSFFWQSIHLFFGRPFPFPSSNIKLCMYWILIFIMFVRFHLRYHRVPDLWKAYEELKPTRRGRLNKCNLNEMGHQLSLYSLWKCIHDLSPVALWKCTKGQSPVAGLLWDRYGKYNDYYYYHDIHEHDICFVISR